jgi:DNA excision repair protein ERCC-4
MASSSRSATLLSDFLSTMDPEAPKGSQGRRMMEDKLRFYLWWKGKLSEATRDGKDPFHMPDASKERFDQSGGTGDEGLSEALKRKDRAKKEKNANRRRVRGGGPGSAASGGGRTTAPKDDRRNLVAGEEEMRDEAENIAELWVTSFLSVYNN